MYRPASRFVLLLTTLALACDDGPSEPDDGAPLDERALSALAGSASLGPAGTFACPAGGEIAREIDVSLNATGDTVDVQFDIALEHRDCAVEIEGDPFILDGQERIEGAQRAVNDGTSIRLLSSVLHRMGRTRVRFRDYDRTCDIDLTQTWDAGRGNYRLTGTMCGNTVDLVLPGLQQATAAI